MAAGSAHRTHTPPRLDARLAARLDAPLPATLPAGGATTVFVAGTCFAPGAPLVHLALTVDGREQPVAAFGMPRSDRLRETGTDEAYRSGFWGFARIAARTAGADVDVGLRARLAGGHEHAAALGRIRVVAPPAPAEMAAPAPGEGPLVAICMATHQPPPALLERQLASIRAQTHRHWVCVIADDGSDAEHRAVIEAAAGDDPRFALFLGGPRLGFYRNFERALALAPAGAAFVALADQDDDWHPDKLASLLAAIGDAPLAYSDARVVRPDGALVASTYWSVRRNNHEDMRALLVTNAVTGAASLVRRDLLRDALPFPPAQFHHFHDHWLALCALAAGGIRYVDRPLYDYVQHGSAFVGHAKANSMPRIRDRVAAQRRGPRERLRAWRMHYFADACRLIQFGSVLEQRFGDRMTPAQREALRAFAAADAGLAPLAALTAAGAKEIAGLRKETLGGEWMLAHAFAWRHLLERARHLPPGSRRRMDAVPPELPDPTPEARTASEPAVRALAAKVEPLALAVRADAPRRINLLIPTLDLRHLYGGYIAKFNLAARLAARGLAVRIVTVDPTAGLPADWAAQLTSYRGLEGLPDVVEIALGREAAALEVSPRDTFIATTWWTAHVAAAALREVEATRFLYLIQEHEPVTFPSGSHAALAEASYRLPHAALFSTELLRGWFRDRGVGVYAAGAVAGDAASVSFQNAITPVEPPPAAELRARRPRRLLVYTRPEPHAARNMYELALLGLERALDGGQVPGDWTLHGIGGLAAGRTADLGRGRSLTLLPRAPQADYGRRLREHDVGLALMHTPHPSLVPIEMAAAGMLAVTSTFEGKPAEALTAISPNLVPAEPTVEGIAAALGRAVARAEDADARVAGAAVAWSRDWEEAFGDALLDRVLALLDD